MVGVGAARDLVCGKVRGLWLVLERLHGVDRTLASGDEQRHGSRLVDVRQVADPGPADPVAAELHVRIAEQSHAPADILGCVLPPAGDEHAPHRLAGPPRSRELCEMDLDGLLGVAFRDALDGEGARTRE